MKKNLCFSKYSNLSRISANRPLWRTLTARIWKIMQVQQGGQTYGRQQRQEEGQAQGGNA